MSEKLQPDRLLIETTDEQMLAYWAKHFRVSRDHLLTAIDKVGNNAAEVRKQLTRIEPTEESS
jgi:hypothetical protein